VTTTGIGTLHNPSCLHPGGVCAFGDPSTAGYGPQVKIVTGFSSVCCYVFFLLLFVHFTLANTIQAIGNCAQSLHRSVYVYNCRQFELYTLAMLVLFVVWRRLPCNRAVVFHVIGAVLRGHGLPVRPRLGGVLLQIKLCNPLPSRRVLSLYSLKRGRKVWKGSWKRGKRLCG
jgi:hypothetical protein